MADPLSKPKARWPQEKQAAFDRFIADVARRLDQLADEGASAEVVVTLHVNRGHFQSGRFDPDVEYS